MKPCVLIVAQFYEPNVNTIIEKLESKGVGWFRLNTETFPLLLSVEWRCENTHDPYSIFKFGSQVLDSRQVTSVWYRRYGQSVTPKSLDATERLFVEGESQAFLLGALPRNCLWINDRVAELRASQKLFQLSLARDIGFRIPKTLVTNDPEKVREFVENSVGPVIFKPVSGVNAAAPDFSPEVVQAFEDQFKHAPKINRKKNDGSSLIFTQILTRDRLKGIKHVGVCPVIFQEQIQKQIELRITIVNSNIFVAGIHSQENEDTRVDFRRFIVSRHGTPRHSIEPLPPSIAEKLLELMRRLGLVFGCVDMILTPEGEYVFLEINPSGQWQWIEHQTGLPISDTLTAALIQ